MSEISLEKWCTIFLEEFSIDNEEVGKSERRWTQKIKRVIHENVFEKMRKKSENVYKCICTLENQSFRKEYMGIDMTWTNEEKYSKPNLIIEIENDDDKFYIGYCFWKLICHKCKRKVLIAFPSNPADTLQHLKEIIEKEFPLEKDDQILILFGEKYKGNFKDYLLKTE